MPPNSRPKRNIRVPPTMRKVPAQSMLRRPAKNGVLGDSMDRKKNRMRNENPPMGTVGLVSFELQRFGGGGHTVQVEAPSPGNASGKGTTDDRSKCTSNGPSSTEEAIVHGAISEGES